MFSTLNWNWKGAENLPSFNCVLYLQIVYISTLQEFLTHQSPSLPSGLTWLEESRLINQKMSKGIISLHQFLVVRVRVSVWNSFNFRPSCSPLNEKDSAPALPAGLTRLGEPSLTKLTAALGCNAINDPPYVRLFVCLYVCLWLCVCLFICLCVCLFVYFFVESCTCLWATCYLYFDIEFVDR